MVYTSEYASPLGGIILACDDNAIIGLWFSGQKYFGSTLPMHTEAKAHPLLQDARRWLDIYFSGKAPGFLPPLRYDSTPFRKAVYDIMLTIPYGRTMTYGQIARELARQQGREKVSAQAVGGAVGHNPISIIIPCHRGLRRQPHRVCRRHRPQDAASPSGGRRYEPFFCAPKRNRTLIERPASHLRRSYGTPGP